MLAIAFIGFQERGRLARSFRRPAENSYTSTLLRRLTVSRARFVQIAFLGAVLCSRFAGRGFFDAVQRGQRRDLHRQFLDVET